MLYSNVLNNTLVSMLIGILINALFLSLLFVFFKPNIAISPKIARCNNILRIKVVNRTGPYRLAKIININSLFFDLSDIKLQCDRATFDGGVTALEPIPLKISNLTFLGKYDKHDKTASYARRFVIMKNSKIYNINPNNQAIRFRIFARHSFSGLGKSFYKDYSQNFIKEGIFEPGDSFDIR